MDDDVETSDVGPKAPSAGVSFGGRRSDLAALLFRNLLLSLTTLGIYRFWAKTRVRAFLWRHVKLLDEPLEYLGNGTELLIGFLIAVVVVAPFTILYSWLPSLAPEGAPHGVLVLQAIYYATFGFLVQVAVYRVRRYRLMRTAWRGVRFGLDGSALKYALIWCLYGVVTLATLGLAYPWLRVATTRYFADNARFGNKRFAFKGGALRLFARWLVVAAPALAAILLFGVANKEALGGFFGQFGGETLDAASIVGAAARLDFAPLGWAAVSAVLLVWYRVSEFRHLVNAVSLGETRFQSSMPARPVYGIQVAFYMCVGFGGFFLMIAASVIVGAFDVAEVPLSPLARGVAAVLVGGAAYWLFGFVKILLVKLTVLDLVCRTLTLAHTEALAQTVQSTAALPGHGEGLADALDMGGF